MKLRQYSDKSIVITCDDNGGESYEKDIEYLTGIGGKFNKFLKGGEGFIFPNYRRKEIENYMATSAARGGSILGQTSMTALANGPLRVAAPLVTEGSVLGDLGASEGGGGDFGLAAARGGDRDACFTEGTSSRHAPATRVPGGPILGPKEACNCIVYIKMLTEKLEIAHLKIEKIEEEILNIKKNKYPKKVNIIDLCDAVFDDDQPVRKRLLR